MTVEEGFKPRGAASLKRKTGGRVVRAPEKLLNLDARRRCSFLKIGRVEHSRYYVDEREDGTIILTPVEAP